VAVVLMSKVEDIADWRRRMAAAAPEIAFRIWPEIGDPAEVRLIAFDTVPDDFTAPPNLGCLSYLGHGVGSFVDHPRLPRDVPITRLVDPGIIRCMVQLALHFVLARRWRAEAYARQQREHRWRKLPLADSTGVRVGVLGLGAIGRRIAEALVALEFPVAGWSRGPHEIPGVECHHGAAAWPGFLADKDIVVCVLPETRETRGLIDAAALAAMKPQAYFINLGRGAVVDEPALLAALDSGHLAGAALDVFATEPLPAESPLWAHPKLTVTPHIGGGAAIGAVEAIVANYRRLLAGEPLEGVADRTRGY